MNAGRGVIFPGFVDVHVHLREPGWEYKEDFLTGTRAAAHGGVTTVADMPNNPEPTVTARAVERKKELARAKAVTDVVFYGGATGDNRAELELMSDTVAGYKAYLARSTGDLLLSDSDLVEVFGAGVKAGLPVSLHCEDQSVIDRASKALEGVGRRDVICDLRPPEAEVEAVRKVIAAAGTVRGARVNVCHTSTEGALGLVKEARSRGVPLECEAALHHLFFNRAAMLESGLLATNPPLRAEGDRAALVQGIRDGTVSFLVTDHAPHTREEKLSKGVSGVTGLDDYAHVVSWLLKEQGVEPAQVVRVACTGPARYLGLSDRGEVAEGKRADLCVLDLAFPERVKPDELMTKCRWSPYEGKEFPGGARWTIRGGETLVEDFRVVV